MKIYFVWLLLMHTFNGTDIVTGFVHEADCRTEAAGLNSSAGSHRAMHWDCVKLSVER